MSEFWQMPVSILLLLEARLIIDILLAHDPMTVYYAAKIMGKRYLQLVLLTRSFLKSVLAKTSPMCR